MSRHVQGRGEKGSLKQIQLLVNERPELLNNGLIEALALPGAIELGWVSPTENDGFAEYRDSDFLRVLGLEKLAPALREFWPERGPQWDALGRAASNEVFLIEAKANIPELFSSCKAGAASAKQIGAALDQTKKHLRVSEDADWCKPFYQYANRLAHLFFLRERGIDAYLAFVYFIGDESVKGPKTKDKWLGALEVAKTCLGVNKRHRLTRYVCEIFVHVNEKRSGA